MSSLSAAVPTHKTCSRCAVGKPATEYYTLKSGRLRASCRQCECELAAIRQGRIAAYKPRMRYEDPPGFKTCRVCTVRKDVRDFASQRDTRDGLRFRCRNCERISNKAYRMAHHEELNARARKRFHALYATVYRAKQAIYYQSHAAAAKMRTRQRYRAKREQIAAYNRQYRRDRPSQYRAYRKAWEKRNPDAVREFQHMYRVRQRGQKLTGRIDWELIRRRDRFICWLCHKKIRRGDVQYDHAIPISKGGEHSTRNIRMAHRLCNQLKSAILLTHQPLML